MQLNLTTDLRFLGAVVLSDGIFWILILYGKREGGGSMELPETGGATGLAGRGM